jgi:tetrahydromethanopterin S-methyltransferase subunit A
LLKKLKGVMDNDPIIIEEEKEEKEKEEEDLESTYI